MTIQKNRLEEGYLPVLNQAVPTTSSDFTLFQRKPFSSSAHSIVTFKSPEDFFTASSPKAST